MIVYLVKSSLCMLLLWGFYTLLLERENMHVTKRFYLIFSLVFSLAIPLITFTYTTDIIMEKKELVPALVHTKMVVSDIPPEVIIANNPINYTPIFLWSLYGLGVFIFGFRFIRNLGKIYRKIKTSEQLKEPSHVNVLINNTVVPYTFLKYIFISKKDYQQKNIPEEVLLHEKTHVLQKHTFDILFIEILQVLFWFNPLLIWIKKSMKLNHEFLADQRVLKQQYSLHMYMNLLVNYGNSANHVALSSPLNYSLTKKRIVMMSQNFSRRRATVRVLLLLPIVIGCMLLFNNEIIAQQKNVTYQKTVQDAGPDKKIKIKIIGNTIRVNGISASISSFANTIDEYTKQWSDDELSDFNFDIQIQNATDGFLDRLNSAYKNTRLYRVNPDNHDLILPPKAPKAPKVKKGVKNSIPKLLTPPSPPVSIDTEEVIEQEIRKAEKEIEEHSEIAHAHIVRQEAREYARHAREEAEETRKRVMKEAFESQKEALLSAQEAREYAKHAREEAEKARRSAMKEAFESRKEALLSAQEAREHAKHAREEAEKARRSVMKEVFESRKEALLSAQKSREHARLAHKEEMRKAFKAKRSELVKRHYDKVSRKEQLEAQEKAIKAELKAVKKRLKQEKKASKS